MHAVLLLVALLDEPVELPVIDCVRPGATLCTSEPPASRFDPPRCDDYELDGTLIEAAQRGDRTALARLQRRYAPEQALQERHRIAAVLLEQLQDDEAVWNELAEEASLAIEFARSGTYEHTGAFVEHCRAANADPDEVWRMSMDALHILSDDPRARTMLHRALQTDDRELVAVAMEGFASQRDLSALGAVAEALRRLRDDTLISRLWQFDSEEADALQEELSGPP